MFSCTTTPPSPLEVEAEFHRLKTTMIENRREADYLAETTIEENTPALSDFRAGDVILIRKISDLSFRLPFQHAVLIVKDPDSKSLQMMEVYSDKPLSMSPLPSPFETGLSRALHLRAKDGGLAEKAATKMVELLKAKTSAGESVVFDEELDYRDHKKLSSFEMIQVAFEIGSDGKFKFTDKMSELELDPRFKTIQEWRDQTQIRLIRQKEAIQNQIEIWTEGLSYRPVKTKKKSRNQPPTPEIQDLLIQVLNENPRPIPYAELISSLEKFRIDDLAVYENRETRPQSRIHLYFRADPEVARLKDRQKTAPKDPRAGTKYPALEN